MSTGPRFQLDYARRVARQLVATLTNSISLEVVGSVRRESETVGDLEFIAPLPADEANDTLYLDLAKRFYLDGAPPIETGGLFSAPVERESKIGEPRRGLNPGFKYAGVTLRLKVPAPAEMAIEFYRYTPGPTGNRGWIQLIRTGPAEFSHRMVMRWQALRGDRERAGSADGFPLDINGHPIAVPDENAAFALLRLPFIEPKDRTPERMPIP